MKNLSIIGSDIVRQVAKALPKELYTINNEFVSINPATFTEEKLGASLNLEKVNGEAYIEDVTKQVFSKIKKSQNEYLLLDLLDCRLDFSTFSVDGKKFLATENNGLKSALKKFNYDVLEKNIALDLSEKQWFNILTKYKDKICKLFPNKKVIVLDVRCANSYISKRNRIYNLGSIDHTSQMYNFFQKIYTIMRLVAPEFIYIPGFDVYYCDEIEASRVFSYALQPQYYEYATKAVRLICEENDISQIPKLRDEYNQDTLKKYKNYDPMAKKWVDCELNNFSGIYEDDFGNYINTNNAQLNITLRGQNNKLVIEEGCNVAKCRISLGNNNNVTIGAGTNIKQDTLIKAENESTIEFGKENNIDGMSLVLRNKTHIKFGDKNRFQQQNIFGIDNECKFIVGNGNDIWKMEMHLFNYASLEIGNTNFFNKNILITGHSYTETIIKNNCIVASEVELIDGDGHSIFDVTSKKKVNNMQEGNNRIVINDHVWLCRRAMLLTGTEIGQGSVVAAGAICNKKYKANNCLIAGIPAKIKKENISWCRNNDTTDIESCAPYACMTDKSEMCE